MHPEASLEKKEQMVGVTYDTVSLSCAQLLCSSKKISHVGCGFNFPANASIPLSTGAAAAGVCAALTQSARLHARA